MLKKLHFPVDSIEGFYLGDYYIDSIDELASMTYATGLHVCTECGSKINLKYYFKSFADDCVYTNASLVLAMQKWNPECIIESGYKYLYVISSDEYNKNIIESSSLSKNIVSALNGISYGDVKCIETGSRIVFYPSSESDFGNSKEKEFWFRYLLIHEMESKSKSAGREVDPDIYRGLKLNPNGSLLDRWAKEVSFNEFYSEISHRVIGQENLRLVLSNIYSYLTNYVNGRKRVNNNMLLAAPSGCGKTETYRAIREYFAKQVPSLSVSIVDVNQITPEGYKGEDTNLIVQDLKLKGSSGLGIVFLDEFDKRLKSYYSDKGADTNKVIQSQLLMSLEGYLLDGIDTSQTLFIGMGSFNDFRHCRDEVKSFGFGETNSINKSHFSYVTREDMIKAGASYELIGRFSFIVNYDELNYEAIDQIINARKEEIEREMNLKISISPSMRNNLHENANTEFGNRLLSSILRQSTLVAYTELLEKNMNMSDCQILLMKGGKYRIINNVSREAI